MELINKEDIKYGIAYNGCAVVEVAEKTAIERLPAYEVMDTKKILDAIRVLNQRALETYKKSVKSRQTYDIVGDPAEKDRALRYEGYADGLTKAVHYIEELINRKVEE